MMMPDSECVCAAVMIVSCISREESVTCQRKLKSDQLTARPRGG
jgi:hypothetical protein